MADGELAVLFGGLAREGEVMLMSAVCPCSIQPAVRHGEPVAGKTERIFSPLSSCLSKNKVCVSYLGVVCGMQIDTVSINCFKLLCTFWS